MYSLMMREMRNILCSVDQECKWGCEEEGQTAMFLNGVWADWQMYLYCYLSGTVMVPIESQWYSAETHCEPGPELIGSWQETVNKFKGTSNWSVKQSIIFPKSSFTRKTNCVVLHNMKCFACIFSTKNFVILHHTKKYCVISLERVLDCCLKDFNHF